MKGRDAFCCECLHLSYSFDEVHFGKFASHYIKREYYFDVHPPLAKMLFALAGWFVGFDGEFTFESIGDSYTENHVPYVGMRALPAVLGSLTVPLIYAIMKETGHSTIIAAFSAIVLLFGALNICFSNEQSSHFSVRRQRSHCPVPTYPLGCDIDFLYDLHHVLLHSLPQTALPVGSNPNEFNFRCLTLA